jgi:hypothetical protein
VHVSECPHAVCQSYMLTTACRLVSCQRGDRLATNFMVKGTTCHLHNIRTPFVSRLRPTLTDKHKHFSISGVSMNRQNLNYKTLFISSIRPTQSPFIISLYHSFSVTLIHLLRGTYILTKFILFLLFFSFCVCVVL